MLYVIATGGKQYLVKSGDVLKIEKLEAEAGKEFVFDKILLTANDDGSDAKVDAPYLTGVTVKAEVLGQGRAKKVLVVKYKRKVRYTRARGHRQPYTQVKIK